MKVHCESCKTPYEVDERRVPPSGLKMRCPKCGTTFSVAAPGSATSVSTGELDLPTLKSPVPRVPPPPPQRSMPVAAVRPQKSDDLRMTPAARPKAGKPRPSDPTGIMYEPPSDPPAPARDELELPLPSKGASEPFSLDLDLPAPKSRDDSFGSLDLPMPEIEHGLAELDLPAVKEDSIDLPVLKNSLDLPAPKRPSGGKLGSPPPVPPVLAAVPAPTLDLPKPRALPKPPPPAEGKTGAGTASFGELDLGGDGSEFDAIPQVSIPGPAKAPSDLSLDHPSLSGSTELEGVVGEEVQPVARVQGGRADRAKGAPKKKGKGLVVAAGVSLVVVAAGVATGFATNYGFFGMYFFERFTAAAGSAESAARVIRDAEEHAATDVFSDVRASLLLLSRARHSEGLNRPLLARSVVHEGLYQARYGSDATSTVHISQILARLDERGGDAPHMALARAADALARNDLNQAMSWIGQARQANASDAYVSLIAGEIALRRNQLDEARSAFERAASQHGGARALWGVARCAMKARAADVEATIAATLSSSPNHAGARTAMAALLLDRGDRDRAVATLREVTTSHASNPEKAEAFAVLGRAHERGGRIGEAHAAYAAALQLEGNRIDVLLGDGHVLLLQKLFADALARFDSVLADPNAQSEQYGDRSAVAEANLGSALAMLELDRAREAREKLVALAAESANDADVLLALGRAERALGNAAEAERKFRDVIRLHPDRFPGYLELSQLFISTGDPAQASAILDEATHAVAESAEVRRLLGESELARGNVPAAIEQFQLALRLDENDAAARFDLGAAFRRVGRIDEAAVELDRVAALDSAYPGLELERGMVFEAQGNAARAVASYRSALTAHPNDLGLQLRLGAAQIASGELAEAEQSLRHVQNEMPNSAEVEHFVGRLSFARNNLRDAIGHFERSVALDGTRAEYRFYLAWALFQTNAFGRALEQVEGAIARDPNLGDAYWIRGEVRLRSGAVADALEDLQRATQLRAMRFEAFAAMSECYDQLRRRPNAIAALRQALEGDATRGDWWYRLGRLQMDDGNRAAGVTAFERAIEIGDAATPPPGWLADAHRWLGEALRLGGDRENAVVHYNRYLQLAPATAIDRADVTRILSELSR